MPTAEALLPWPADAVMIVAANAGEERRAKMEGIHRCACCHCWEILHADTAVVRHCQRSPWRDGRPIRFFCVECATTRYDMQTIEHLEDHR
ncbi:MAG: hypothetical protein KF774_17665 [Planctomyces sp.]|nr:hypothetical protein [Planctomyces sp.]